jgi:sugar phosphate isomerase/epimerase
MPKASRRDFLKSAATAGAGATMALSGLTGDARLFADDDKPGFEDQFCKCNETFVDWPPRKTAKFVAECGYKAIEIAPFTVSQFVTDVPQKRRERLRKAYEDANVKVAGLHWILSKTEGFHLTSPDKKVRKATAKYLCDLAQFCSDLGGDIMIFGSPKQRDLLEGVSMEQGMTWASEVLKETMPTMEKLDVTIAMEPLGPNTTNFLLYAADTVELAERVDSPYCKMMLDCKAMIQEEKSIPELIHEFKDWMVHFHANDANLRGPGMGDLDFVPIFQALHEIDYKRWISVEVFDYEPGAEALAKESIDYMRKVEAQLAAK